MSDEIIMEVGDDYPTPTSTSSSSSSSPPLVTAEEETDIVVRPIKRHRPSSSSPSSPTPAPPPPLLDTTILLPMGTLFQELIVPYLDRKTWNHLSVTNTEVYQTLHGGGDSNDDDDDGDNTNGIVPSPPWPTSMKYSPIRGLGRGYGGPCSMIQTIAVSCTTEWIAFGHHGGMIQVWNSKSGIFTNLSPSAPIIMNNNNNSITTTDILPSFSHHCFGTVDQIIFSPYQPHWMVTNIRSSTSTTSSSGRLRLWDLRHHHKKTSLTDSSSPITTSYELTTINDEIDGHSCRIEFVVPPTRTTATTTTTFDENYCHLACSYHHKQRRPRRNTNNNNNTTTTSFTQSISIWSVSLIPADNNTLQKEKNQPSSSSNETKKMVSIQCLQQLWTISRPDWISLVDFAIVIKQPLLLPSSSSCSSFFKTGGGDGNNNKNNNSVYQIVTMHKSTATIMFGSELCLWDDAEPRGATTTTTTTDPNGRGGDDDDDHGKVLRTPVYAQEVPAYRAYALSPPPQRMTTTTTTFGVKNPNGNIRSTNRRLLATVLQEDFKKIRLWSLPQSRCCCSSCATTNQHHRHRQHHQQSQNQKEIMIRASQNVNCVIFSANAQTLAVGCDTGTIEIWDMNYSDNNNDDRHNPPKRITTDPTDGTPRPRLRRTLAGEYGIQSLTFIQDTKQEHHSPPHTLLSLDFFGNLQFWNV